MCIKKRTIQQWKKDGYENKIPWIENQISTIGSNATQPHFYIAAGELENKPLLTANRRLYKVLKEKEYQILTKSFKAVTTVFGGEKSYLMG